MKRISYILGIALFVLFTAGLLVIGFHAPQGEPPYSYLEAQKEEVSVDSFETRGIRGVEGFWLYDMPDANINIIIRTTNDPRKCRVTYPKDLIRMVRTATVLRCAATPKGKTIDSWMKHRLVHKYSDFDVRVLADPYDDKAEITEKERRNCEYNNGDIFIYMTVRSNFEAIRNDSPDCYFYLYHVKLPSLYYTNQERGCFSFLGRTHIDDFWCAWISDRLNMGEAHIKNMKIELGYDFTYMDDNCKVGHLLVTGKGNLYIFNEEAYRTIEVKEKKYGDITYGTDSIPMVKLMNKKK